MTKRTKIARPFRRSSIIEFATSILEFANRRRDQLAAFAVSKIQTPLVGLGIVQTKRQTFNVTGWAIDFEFYQIGAPIPYLANYGGTWSYSAHVVEPVSGCANLRR